MFFLRMFFLFCMLLTPVMANADGNQSVIAAKDESVLKIVAISKDAKGNTVESHGSGFVVSEDGYVITNYHVVDEADKIYVLDGGLDEINLQDATVSKTLKSHDLALLAVPNLKRKPLSLFDGELVDSSDVWSVGYPGPAMIVTKSRDKDSYEKNVVTASVGRGTLSRVAEMALEPDSDKDVAVVEHSASINHGNSGGPLLNNCGAVVGINTFSPSKELDSNGLFYAVGVSEILAFLDKTNVKYMKTANRCGETGEQLSSGIPFSQQTLAVVSGVLFLLMLLGLVIRKARNKGSNTSGLVPANGLGGQRYCLRSLGGAENFMLDKDTVRIGRAITSNDYAIANESVSRQHLQLSRSGDTWWVEDLGSANGTEINGRPVFPHQARQLLPNDTVTMGDVSFLFNVA